MSRHPALVAGLALLLAPALWFPPHRSCLAVSLHGDASMLEPRTAALLVDYFEAFLRDKDIEVFRRNVMTRYTEGTLTRLVRSGNVQARRAAMLALGLSGTFASNPIVARGLRDPDPAVRNLAQNTLWAIWYRAGDRAQNARLQEVRDLIGRERNAEARDLASKLIDQAPNFAEAYNQKAIALFFLDEFAASATECRNALERNPYHIGALSGLGQCYLRLGRKNEALTTFRRALKVQPYSAGLKETVERLESLGD